MSKSRIKTSAIPAAITRDQAESLVSLVTALTIESNALVADMDSEIAKARSRYETSIGNLTARIEKATGTLRDWSLANPEEFGKKKSIEFTQGTIGFRTGTPKLKTLSGFTFARVLDALRSVKWGAAFILVKEDVAKAELIAAHSSQNITPEELRQIGVRVDQDESFFVDPAVTENEPRQSVAAKEGK